MLARLNFKSSFFLTKITKNLNISARMSWSATEDFEAYESLKAKEKSSWVIPKVVAVFYKSFSLQSLTQRLNGVSQRWSYLVLVAYESGR